MVAIAQLSTALVRRISYRHGMPFLASTALAVVTTAWPIVREARFHKGTSFWTFALLATLCAAFTLLYGGRFRSFFIVIAVTPPFLFVFGWFLRMRSAFPYYPSNWLVPYFVWFVAAPILLVWIVARLLNQKERHA